MKKNSGLSFAVWINWIFFGLFFVFSALAVWAIFIQTNTNLIAKLEAIIILLFITVLPAVIFLINAILLRKISKENSPADKSESFSEFK